jgi:hypothetical protein
VYQVERIARPEIRGGAYGRDSLYYISPRLLLLTFLTYYTSLLSHIVSKPDHHVSYSQPYQRLTARSKPIIAVVFYSTYGHIEQLAEGIIKGVEATGAEVRPYVLYVPPPLFPTSCYPLIPAW